jgi:hypothetical protein
MRSENLAAPESGEPSNLLAYLRGAPRDVALDHEDASTAG